MEIRGFFQRHSLWILVAAWCVLPVIFFGALRSIQSNTNQVEDWLPSTFRETQDLKKFRKHFAADQFVIISWPDCRLGTPPGSDHPEPDDPKIERLVAALLAENEKVEGGYFKSITTGRRVLDQLVIPPGDVPYDEAIRRLQGSLIGPDGRQTCVVATLKPTVTKKLRAILGRPAPKGPFRLKRPTGVVFHALATCGITPDEVHLGGPPVDNVAIDEEGERTLIRLAGLSALLGLGLAYWSLRNILMTMIVFWCGIVSAALAMAIVWYSGQNMDAILLSMPALVYVLAISGAVHIINYYRDAMHEHGPEVAVAKAVGHAWKPAFLCSVTTAFGLGSLYWSQLAPIRNFGLYSAIGVLTTVIVLFTALPAALQLFFAGRAARQAAALKGAGGLGDSSGSVAAPHFKNGKKKRKKGRREKAAQRLSGAAASVGGAAEQKTPPRALKVFSTKARQRTFSDRLWGRCAYALVRHYWKVSIASLAIIAGMSWGLGYVRTSIDLLKLFDGKARILKDYAWFEEHLGPLVPLEILLSFPREMQQEGAESRDPARLSFLDRMEVVDLCQRLLEARHGEGGSQVLGRSMSPVTFVPPLPSRGGGVFGMARRNETSKKMYEERESIMASGYLKLDEDQTELWRISLRAAAFKDVDYQVLLRETEQTMQPVLAAQKSRREIVESILAKKTDSPLAGTTVRLGIDEKRIGEFNENQQGIYRTALRYLLQGQGVRVVWQDNESQGADRPLARKGTSAVELTVPMASDLATVDAKTDVSAIYTGVVPIVYKAQRELLQGLIQSTCWSFLTITPLMMWVCRSVLAGLVVMLPNALPVLVVFGGMGWLGVPVDIGSMMAASIALGVAVDDTIHYLTWFKEELHTMGNRERAILSAYRRCANPTLQSALISGLGLSVFAFSTFTPTQRFGWLMLTILIAGVIAELFMLPAILAGPMGRVFKVKRKVWGQRGPQLPLDVATADAKRSAAEAASAT